MYNQRFLWIQEAPLKVATLILFLLGTAQWITGKLE